MFHLYSFSFSFFHLLVVYCQLVNQSLRQVIISWLPPCITFRFAFVITEVFRDSHSCIADIEGCLKKIILLGVQAISRNEQLFNHIRNKNPAFSLEELNFNFYLLTVLNVFLLSLQNAAVTSQDLISRKIKEYNMMRYAGHTFYIAAWGSTVVLHHISTHFNCQPKVNICAYVYFLIFCWISAPSSRSEPSPKTSRQSLSIKQALLGGKTDGKIHSPHSPKTGEERRGLRGKELTSI